MPTAPHDQPPSRAGSLALIGGVLALDFCNTSSGRGSDAHEDHLRTAADLLAWARHAAILDEHTEAHLRSRCAESNGFGETLLTRALRLREAIYHLNAALAHGEPADQNDLDVIAIAQAACLGKGRLSPRDGAFAWAWDVELAPAEAVLGPIAASAMMVITAADQARLKQCAGHQCGWLFLDTTKSNNRRWCEMEVCGNRAKQKRRRQVAS